MRETLSDMAELLLAPMLAILAYFFLYQGTAPNIYTISIVSFTVGLVTKDFIGRLEEFAKSKLGVEKEQEEKTNSLNRMGAGIT
jgi:hypothetical protein